MASQRKLLQAFFGQRHFGGTKFSNSASSKIGLVIAAVFAMSSTTTALDSASISQRERLPNRRVYCEPIANGNVAKTSVEDAESLSKELSSSKDFRRLNTPARLELDTHAVTGLFDPRKIGRYEIYKRVGSATEETVLEGSQIHNHVVTALVDFGDSLDGHPGVVHGGVIALILDDIFGFAFGALGVPKAVTANLSLDYRTPTPAPTSVLVKIYLDRQENRKLYFKGEITSLNGSVLYTQSSCLYVIPRDVWQTMGNQT